jgi:hypothetical protein
MARDRVESAERGREELRAALVKAGKYGDEAVKRGDLATYNLGTFVAKLATILGGTGTEAPEVVSAWARNTHSDLQRYIGQWKEEVKSADLLQASLNAAGDVVDAWEEKATQLHFDGSQGGGMAAGSRQRARAFQARAKEIEAALAAAQGEEVAQGAIDNGVVEAEA